MRTEWCVGCLCALLAASAYAKPVTYVLVIGNNAPPIGEASTRVEPLKYADDDAANVYSWASSFATEVQIMATFDEETKDRYPGLARHALPPTLEVLSLEVKRFHALLLDAHDVGDTSTFIFYMSGFGRSDAPSPRLAFEDGDLTQDAMFSQVLAQLPADHVHVLVDACHAEAVVSLVADSALRWFQSNMQGAYPNVGAIVSTSWSGATGELAAYHGGAFTHELLSGLRGGADVNGDRRIEYSEAHAFVDAANHSLDANSRLRLAVRFPPGDIHAPLVDLRQVHGVGWVTDVPPALQHFYIENSHGVRFVEANVEAGHLMRLQLPVGANYTLQTTSGYATLDVNAGRSVSLKNVTLTLPASPSAADLGFFATPFGPAYYRFFVAEQKEPSVDFLILPLPEGQSYHFNAFERWAPWAVTGAAVLATGVLGGLMYDSPQAGHHAERVALGVAIGTAVAGAAVGTVIQVLESGNP